MSDTRITIVGNLVATPDLRFTPAGVAVANFTIASTPRRQDKRSGQWEDGEPLFVSCSVWRQYAEHVAETLQKGMRVIATGRLRSRSYETQQGERRSVLEMDVEEVGPSLRYATCQVQRANSGGGAPRQAPQTPANDPWGAQQVTAADPWSQQTAVDDAPPF